MQKLSSVQEVDCLNGLPPVDGLLRVQEPVVLRNFYQDCPIVKTQEKSATEYKARLTEFDHGRPVNTLIASQLGESRLFYNDRLDGVNFDSHKMALSDVLDAIFQQANEGSPRTIYMGSTSIRQQFPQLYDRLTFPYDLPEMDPRIWISTPAFVQTHFDRSENIACNILGERRFTFFPPEQIENLYIGPIEYTPAGAPVSMVDLRAPDLEKYPKFESAMEHAQVAELEQGDAVYIPFHWWHAVESLSPVNILINYWWMPSGAPTHLPIAAMFHSLLAMQGMPDQYRRVWSRMFNHLVFRETGDPVDHLPAHRKGILGDLTPQMKRQVQTTVQGILASEKL